MEKTLYFGYGLNRNPEFLQALLGRIPENYDTASILKDHELRIQRHDDLPELSRRIIGKAYGSDFRSYVIYMSPGKEVGGTTWAIKPEELAILNYWELEGDWHNLAEVVITGSVGKYSALTHICKYDKGIAVPDSISYPDFIVDREKIIRSALIEWITWKKDM